MSLALSTKATLDGWPNEAGQYKVVDLVDFAAGHTPFERSVFDLRGLPAAERAQLASLPWSGFLVNGAEHGPEGRPWIHLHGAPETAKAGDVIETQPLIGKVAVRYRRGSNGNVLFATERCDNYCLMCSQPPREVADEWRLRKLLELVELIDRNEPALAISGGEPTLLGDGLVRLIAKCAEQLPETGVHVLSNGRAFRDTVYATRFTGLNSRLSWGIPLYGDHFALHDYVVQRAGAFAETLRGLYALARADQCIEIRVVLVKPTVQRLEELARFIYRNLSFVEHVALMGIEPIGFAKANHESLWIDSVDMAEALTGFVSHLSLKGIPVSLYNLPLCMLPAVLWPFAKRGISDWKQDYEPECERCAIKNRCSGFFSWVTEEWRGRSVQPILEDSL